MATATLGYRCRTASLVEVRRELGEDVASILRLVRGVIAVEVFEKPWRSLSWSFVSL